jgi:hypothetical protein
MAYQDFLTARRPLLAKVVRDAFSLLCDPAYAPEYPSPAGPEPVVTERAHNGVSISDLMDAGLLEAGDILVNAGDGGTAAGCRRSRSPWSAGPGPGSRR